MSSQPNLFFRICLSLVIMMLLGSCKSSKVNTDKTNNTLLCSLVSTPCFGRCPVYEIKIYESGLLLYKGQRNVEDTFCHFRQINEKELKKLKDAFAKAEFFGLNSTYPFDERAPVDLPSSIIFFKSNNQEKTVVDHHWKTPEKLGFLERKIDSLASGKFLQFCDK